MREGFDVVSKKEYHYIYKHGHIARRLRGTVSKTGFVYTASVCYALAMEVCQKLRDERGFGMIIIKLLFL